MRAYSAAGPVIVQPPQALAASLIAALPPVWSGCQWVFQMSLIAQPRAAAASSTGSATAGSTAIVAPLAGSWTSQT